MKNNDRFQAAAVMKRIVAAVGELVRAVDEHETEQTRSINELKRLVRAQGAELHALRARLKGG